MKRETIRREWRGPAVMMLLVAWVFGGALFSGGTRMVSAAGTDLHAAYVPWRAFAAGHLRAGEVPLWNPHSFCGTPFAGNMQSAMFYPPNLAMLSLSEAAWANWSIAGHVWLAGILAYGWARYRGVSRVGATVAGVTYMFCAPVTMRIVAGHVPWVSVLAWGPGVFWCADGLLDGGGSRWVIAGAFVVAMQLLAGSPHPAYIVGLAASIYIGANLLRRLWDGPKPKAAAVAARWAGVFVLGAMLAGVQVGVGAAASAESLRGGKISLAMSAAGAMPVRNLAMLIVPAIFGDEVRGRYASEGFVWEVAPYVGAVSLGLAMLAERGRRRFGWVVVIAMGMIAVGTTTPVYGWLYRALPGFGQMRVPGRYLGGAAPVVALLAGMGVDRLRGWSREGRRGAVTAVAGVAAGVAIFVGVAGVGIARSGESGLDGAWGRMLVSIGERPGVSLQIAPGFFHDPAFARETAAFAVRQCWVAAGFIGAFAIVAGCAVRWPRAACGVAVVAVAELTGFMLGTRTTCPERPAMPAPWLAAATAASRAGERVWCPVLQFANDGMLYGFDNVSGYDPLGLRRYAQLIVWAQGERRAAAIADPVVTWDTPAAGVLRLLRCRYVLGMAGSTAAVAEVGKPMGALKLVGRYEVIADRTAGLARVCDDRFDPRATVVLEDRPVIEPAGDAGEVTVVRRTSDTLEIRADVPRATILLVTDAYSAGWRARGLPGSVQERYTVMPADVAVRAVPLRAGSHHFVMEYRPVEWTIGKWVSVVTILGLGAATVAMAVAGRRRRSAGRGRA